MLPSVLFPTPSPCARLYPLHMVHVCLKHMSSCATALGGHFLSTADHLPLLASSSLSSGSVSRSHFSVRRFERFMSDSSSSDFIFNIYTPHSRAHISKGPHGDCGVFLEFCALFPRLIESVPECIGHFFVVLGWKFRRSII